MNGTATNTHNSVIPADPITPQQLVSSLCTVPERSMRTNLLVEKLCVLEPETVAELLQGIITAAVEQRGNYCLALEALDVLSLTRKTGNSFMSDVYVHAQNYGFEELVRILSRPAPSRVFDSSAESSSDEIPSGVRIARAKNGKRNQLTRMFSDTNPQVVRTLLNNPALIESDVLKLASRRPAAEDVQREVFRSRKWSSRYSVKKALILNPYTPTDIGMKIVHVLMVQDVRHVAQSRDLHPWICETARNYLGTAGC